MLNCKELTDSYGELDLNALKHIQLVEAVAASTFVAQLLRDEKVKSRALLLKRHALDQLDSLVQRHDVRRAAVETAVASEPDAEKKTAEARAEKRAADAKAAAAIGIADTISAQLAPKATAAAMRRLADDQIAKRTNQLEVRLQCKQLTVGNNAVLSRATPCPPVKYSKQVRLFRQSGVCSRCVALTAERETSRRIEAWQARMQAFVGREGLRREADGRVHFCNLA